VFVGSTAIRFTQVGASCANLPMWHNWRSLSDFGIRSTPATLV
jgi:hypothetical protein